MYYVKSIYIRRHTIKTLANVEIIISNNEVSYNYKGTLYTEDDFKDKFFPTHRLVRMPGLLLPAVGKLVAFFDKPDESFITYGILNEINFNEDHPYIREGDYSHWKYARRLTQEEIEELI